MTGSACRRLLPDFKLELDAEAEAQRCVVIRTCLGIRALPARRKRLSVKLAMVTLAVMCVGEIAIDS